MRLAKALAQRLDGTPQKLRVDFLELWPEIREALAKRYRITEVYAALQAEGRWRGCYETLRRYVQREQQREQRGGQAPRVTTSSVAPGHKRNPMLPSKQAAEVPAEAEQYL